MPKSNCILEYQGPVNDEILTQLRDKYLLPSGVSPKLERKLFMVLVELGQNIAKYSAERSNATQNGIGSLAITQIGESLVFSTQNLTTKSSAVHVVQRCKELSTMDRKRLRDLRKDIMSQPLNPNHTGANLGLIQLNLHAETPLISSYKSLTKQNKFVQLSMKVKVKAPTFAY